MKCKLTKLAKGVQAAPVKKLAVGDPQPGGVELAVTETGGVTVYGADAQGNRVDISGIATLTVSSGDESITTVDSPVGMSFNETAVKLGHADVTITATSNDPAGFGTLSILDHVDVIAGPVTGLIVTHGPPTVV